MLQKGQNQTQDYIAQLLSRYYTNNELGSHLQDFATRCSAIAKLSVIGKSVKGVPLWVLEISDRPGQHEPEPNVKQLLPALAEWLCQNYKTDPVAKRVVQDMHLFLLPSMNPDGYEAHDRLNAHQRDLNRNFPDPIINPSLQPSGREEPEVQAVMNWTLHTPGGFVAGGSLHEGELVVNYPWDGTASGQIATYNASSDDETFRYLSLVYAQHNPGLLKSQDFENGITNGAAWYGIYGGMQDWDYVAAGDFDVTLELSKNKTPSNLYQLWEDNRQSLLDYVLTAALGGVRGRVYQSRPDAAGAVYGRKGNSTAPGGRTTTLLLIADVTVEGIDKVVKSKSPYGDFYRPLAPGDYTVMFSAPGYVTETTNVTVPGDGSGVGLDVFLAPA
ncbi:hypothetical protein N2152v2_010403 [Parachlorella kessleri]